MKPVYVSKTLITILFFSLFAIKANSQVTIGAGEAPADGLLLDLKQWESKDGLASADKGLKLPRVELENLTSLAPLTADGDEQKKILKGTVVYNIKPSSTLEEGIYVWDGSKWEKPVNKIPTNTIQLMNMNSNMTTIFGKSDGTGGATFDFPTLTIPENGAYAFSFRLYGLINKLSETKPTARCVYYISAWAGTTLIDIAEINLFAGFSEMGSNYTYSITLGGSFNENDIVTFKISHLTSNTWTLVSGSNLAANRTSMIWWKLRQDKSYIFY